MKTSAKRMTAEKRKEQILRIYTDLSICKSYARVTVQEIAQTCSISIAIVHHYFGSREALETALLQRALKLNISHLIDQGRVLNHELFSEPVHSLRG